MRAGRLALAAVPLVLATSAAAGGYELPPDELAKAEALYRIHTALYLASLVLGAAVPLALLELGIARRFRDLAERAGRRRIVQAVVFVPLVLLATGVLSLPLGAVQQYVARAYRLSVQGWGSWLGDWAKGQLVACAIAVPMVLGLYAIVRRSPARWWLYFWLLTVPVAVFLIFVGPILIDPLFNTFEPLDETEPQLVEPLERVAARGGLEIPRERMFEMKASEKVTTYNAYVTGLGATKRVVVWDNTARDLTAGETSFVFGHELGHYVLGHVYQLLAFALTLLLACFWLVRRLVLWALAHWSARWGVRGVDDWASLPVFVLALSVVWFAATPVFLAFDRHIEHQADVYGIEVTHGLTPDPGLVAAAAFQKLGEKALAYPNPNRLLVLWTFGHPPIGDRIDFALGYEPWSAPAGPAYVK